MKSVMVYGQLDQQARTDAITRFRRKHVKVLIVTDLAARGLDIPLLSNVINYNFPPSMKLFIHRCGRTARAGQKGTCYNFLNIDEAPYLVESQVYMGRSLQSEEEFKSRSGDEQKLDLKDPKIVQFGTITQSILDRYHSYIQ